MDFIFKDVSADVIKMIFLLHITYSNFLRHFLHSTIDFLWRIFIFSHVYIFLFFAGITLQWFLSASKHYHLLLFYNGARRSCEILNNSEIGYVYIIFFSLIIIVFLLNILTLAKNSFSRSKLLNRWSRVAYFAEEIFFFFYQLFIIMFFLNFIYV